MAATVAVMEKTANMYMQLIADVEKRGECVFCMCEVRGGGKETWQVLEHSPST